MGLFPQNAHFFFELRVLLRHDDVTHDLTQSTQLWFDASYPLTQLSPHSSPPPSEGSTLSNYSSRLRNEAATIAHCLYESLSFKTCLDSRLSVNRLSSSARLLAFHSFAVFKKSAIGSLIASFLAIYSNRSPNSYDSPVAPGFLGTKH